MPVSITNEIIQDTWDASKFRAALASKLLSVGYIQEATSGSESIFRINAPNSPSPKDRAYLRTLIEQPSGNSIKLQCWMGDGISGLTLTPNTIPIFADQTFNNALFLNYNGGENFPIRWVTFNSTELKLVAGYRSDNNAALFSFGYLFPSVKPVWWPNTCLYGFAVTRDAGSFRVIPGNPFSTNYVDLVFNPTFFPSNTNPGGTRDIVKRLILCPSAGDGVAGLTSSDLGVIAANGLGILAQPPTSEGQTWMNLRSGAWSLAVRIA